MRTGRLATGAALLLLVGGGCELVESPTAPSDASPAIAPSFSFTGGSGKVLGSTNQGGLVEIDLDLGTMTLIGDAGTVAGDNIGWTDIALDDAGALFGLSRHFTETEFEPHLYVIDPGTGLVDSIIGSPGEFLLLADLDHNGTQFYGSGAVNAFCCRGGLFTIGATDAGVTWISSDTLGYGLNPYDTVGSSDPITMGGFAVHPGTGDLWGIENLRSDATLLFRINPTTGLPDSILSVEMEPPHYGYDGLHILDDGTFIATKATNDVPLDSALWEISSVPDPTSGLAEVQLIPLTADTLIVGNLNGLEAFMGAPDSTISIELTADTTELHPWIRQLSIHDTLQPERQGDSVAVVAEVLDGGVPLDSVAVSYRAELVSSPDSAGHDHYTESNEFKDLPTVSAPQAPLLSGTPVAGHFREDSSRVTSVEVGTDTLGVGRAWFVAGLLGGEVDVIASIVVAGDTLADTLRLAVRVPNLVALDNLVSGVYFVGGTPSVHPQGTNWYVVQEMVTPLQTIADSLKTTIGGNNAYLQYNDASLRWGGAFSSAQSNLLAVTGSSATVDNAFADHRAHAHGIDVDISLCYALDQGVDQNQENRVNFARPDPESAYDCYVSGVTKNSPLQLNRVTASALLNLFGDARIHPDTLNGNHFHIRFWGS